MTENKYTIEELIDFMYNVMDDSDEEAIPFVKEVIQALEEIKQIKEIIADFPLDCGNTVNDVKEIWNQLSKYLKIGTVEEFKALKENQHKCEDCAGCTNWKCDCENVRTKAIDESVERFRDWIFEKHGLSQRDMCEINEIVDQLKGGAT